MAARCHQSAHVLWLSGPGYGANEFTSNALNSVNVSPGAATLTSFYLGKLVFGQSVTEANLSKNLDGLAGTKTFNLAL